MIKKVHYSEAKLKKAFLEIMVQVSKDNWVPDYVIGLNRGGLIPGVWASHHLQVPHHTLNVCLRDHEYLESNQWMAEDAFGFDHDRNNLGYLKNCKQILMFDDINDSGSTFEWIKEDWRGACYPEGDRWRAVWGQNVRTAALVDNLASSWELNYSGIEINKAEEDCWVVFPWEEM